MEILSKPGRITESEYNHAQAGYDILNRNSERIPRSLLQGIFNTIEFSWPIAQIVLQHHERMDGSGYPNGLLGKEILIEAKILGVADVVEAMSSHRPYRPALGIDKALEEISNNKGKLYDAEVVNACLSVFKDKKFKFK